MYLINYIEKAHDFESIESFSYVLFCTSFEYFDIKTVSPKFGHNFGSIVQAYVLCFLYL